MSRLTPSQRAQRIHARATRDAALARHILADRAPKEFAADHGITKQAISRIAAHLGFRRIFVTPAERTHIMQLRSCKPLLDGQSPPKGE